MTEIYLEMGAKKVFAAALDWPGWCRSGRTEEAAISALDDYAERYAVVAERAGIAFKPGVLSVVEKVQGGATTDFGAPEKVVSGDAKPITAAKAKRQAALLRAAWDVFDAGAATAPAELRKGPRGGGRDRDKMIDHVLDAEKSYARMIGVKHKKPAIDDRHAIEALRADILAVLGRASDGEPLRERGWPSRYAARRIAWHVLDHLWEMQDRAD